MDPVLLVIWLTPLMPALVSGYMLKKNGKTTFQAATFSVFVYLFLVLGQWLLIVAANRWDIPFSALMLALALAVFGLFWWHGGVKKG